jgi:hypothetical protein
MWRALLLSVFCAIAGPVAAVETLQGSGAILRGLDKVGGRVHDIDFATGAYGALGRLRIELVDCRYPQDNATGDGFAFLNIFEGSNPTAIFSGWMIASAPALNPLDHARYDVWVLRCKIK